MFTDLAIGKEGQGYVLQFEVAQDAALGGLRVSSSPINVYAPVTELVILQQPENSTIGDDNTSTAVVEIEARDRFGSRSVYASGPVLAAFEGSLMPRCPPGSKTLHIHASNVSSTFRRYSMAISDEFAADPSQWREGVNTIDQQEFLAMLEQELDVKATTADKTSLFNTFDLRGQTDADGLDVPDGELDLSEFAAACQLCTCTPGTAVGKATLTPNAVKYGFDLSITDRCQDYRKCAPGYLGKACRRANAQLSRSLPRIAPLQGTTRVPLVYGRAQFTDLSFREAVKVARLSFTLLRPNGNRYSTLSDPFGVEPCLLYTSDAADE